MVIINKNKNKKILVLFFSILVFISIFFLFHRNIIESKLKKIENINFVEIGGQKIKIEIAYTPEMQEKGLSGRKEIKENEGMLFIFKNSGKYPFWMKDMNFPIDIIWLDQDKKIIFFKENVLPNTFPETFVSEKEAKYVLEVISGFSQKNNLKIGEIVEFLL